MKSDRQRLRSGEIGSGAAKANQNNGLARVPEPSRVDLAYCKLHGWDFRDLAAFLRAQDADWVQRTGF